MNNNLFLKENFLAFAHRGGNEFASRKFYKSFKNAVDMGYRYLETDVHLTKDGYLIAFHDNSLDRVTNKTGLIKDLTYVRLRRLKSMAVKKFLYFRSFWIHFQIAFLILI